MPTIISKSLMLAAILALAACAQTGGKPTGYGAATRTGEPTKAVECTNSGDWGLGWSQDCHNRNAP
ncbi:hypothetical protein ACFSM5_04905 [Lacibacterium aquatile]|uniref:Lipoprotein n=1 Tax=Lacibacterium aquatile TaxID=1168082 RepID=A0ABW5DMD9_9PROT